MLAKIRNIVLNWFQWEKTKSAVDAHCSADDLGSGEVPGTSSGTKKDAQDSSEWVSDIPDETIQQWLVVQQDLEQKIVRHDTESWASSLEDLNLVGGLDVSYTKENESQACACLVVYSINEKKIVYSICELVTIETKYRTGFLAFREIAPMMQLWGKIKDQAPEFLPSVTIIDGNGIMHERGIGLASHFGVLADCPTIGVAKSPPYGNFTYVPKDGMLEREAFVHDGDRVVGAAIIGDGKGRRPIYISIGNRVSLDSAIAVVRLCCKYRLPEPTRYADIQSREALRRNNLTPINGAAEDKTAEGTDSSSPELQK